MLREEFQLEIQPDHLPSRGSYLISNLPFTIDWKLKKKNIHSWTLLHFIMAQLFDIQFFGLSCNGFVYEN